jgi:hypothetical protein
MREVITMMGVGRCREKKRKKERKKKKKKKTERYLVYWGLFYFGAIFELKLSCHLGIGCCKSWVLQSIRIEVKFFFLTSIKSLSNP